MAIHFSRLFLYNDFLLGNKKRPHSKWHFSEYYFFFQSSNIAKLNALGCQYLEISSTNEQMDEREKQISFHSAKANKIYI